MQHGPAASSGSNPKAPGSAGDIYSFTAVVIYRGASPNAPNCRHTLSARAFSSVSFPVRATAFGSKFGSKRSRSVLPERLRAEGRRDAAQSTLPAAPKILYAHPEAVLPISAFRGVEEPTASSRLPMLVTLK